MLKVLLIPLAIAAFVVFLLVLGAIGLGIAMATITAIGKFFQGVAWVVRFLNRGGRRLRSRRLRKRRPESASAD